MLNSFTITIDCSHFIEWDVVHAYYTVGAPSSSLMLVPTIGTQKALKEYNIALRFFDNKLVLYCDPDDVENILKVNHGDFDFQLIFMIATKNKEVILASDIPVTPDNQIKFELLNFSRKKLVHKQLEARFFNQLEVDGEEGESIQFEEMLLSKKFNIEIPRGKRISSTSLGEGMFKSNLSTDPILLAQCDIHPSIRVLGGVMISGPAVKEILEKELLHQFEHRIERRNVLIRYRIIKRNAHWKDFKLKGKSSKEFTLVEQQEQYFVFETKKEIPVKEQLKVGEDLELWGKKANNFIQLRKAMPAPSIMNLVNSSKEGVWAIENTLWV